MGNPIRLTADNMSKRTLETVAINTAGLLGMYTLDEYSNLCDVDQSDWTFEWSPSKLDQSVGRVKMRPRSMEATNLLDRGRSKQLCDRHTSLTMYHATALIKLLKRSKLGMSVSVQDFLVKHGKSSELLQSINEVDQSKFCKQIRKYSQNKLTASECVSVYHLFTKVNKILTKPIPKKKRSKTFNLRLSRGNKPKTQVA